LVYGNLKFKLKNNEKFDCLSSNEGVRIPTPHIPIVDIESDARLIIIIEKDSVLQKIIKQESSTNFVDNYKVILFTARGYPDLNSRAFLKKLWMHLKIPIFALTDGDPHGAEIACCYKFGCFATASESSYLAIPQIRWLGLLPSDVEKHPISQSSLINLTENDHNKLKSMCKRPYLRRRTEWLYQLGLMRDMGKKAELESIDIHGDYLTRTFIPNKLRYASWV
jgi:DNA topoisomerase VI subunit A